MQDKLRKEGKSTEQKECLSSPVPMQGGKQIVSPILKINYFKLLLY